MKRRVMSAPCRLRAVGRRALVLAIDIGHCVMVPRPSDFAGRRIGPRDVHAASVAGA